MLNAADAARVRVAISTLTRDELWAHMLYVRADGREPMTVPGFQKISYLYDWNDGESMNPDTAQIFVYLARVRLELG
jgi:hypothetical protein